MLWRPGPTGCSIKHAWAGGGAALTKVCVILERLGSAVLARFALVFLGRGLTELGLRQDWLEGAKCNVSK